MKSQRYLQCTTCMNRVRLKCKTISLGQRADIRGIFLYTRINGCPNHSSAYTKNSSHIPRYNQIKKRDQIDLVVVSVEQLSENVYKVWYQPFKNEVAIGDQYRVFLTKNEFEFTMVREKLVREYKVPVEYIEKLIHAAQRVSGDEWKDYSEEFSTEKMISV